jgi:hypothetical protein
VTVIGKRYWSRGSGRTQETQAVDDGRCWPGSQISGASRAQSEGSILRHDTTSTAHRNTGRRDDRPTRGGEIQTCPVHLRRTHGAPPRDAIRIPKRCRDSPAPVLTSVLSESGPSRTPHDLDHGTLVMKSGGSCVVQPCPLAAPWSQLHRQGPSLPQVDPPPTAITGPRSRPSRSFLPGIRSQGGGARVSLDFSILHRISGERGLQTAHRTTPQPPSGPKSYDHQAIVASGKTSAYSGRRDSEAGRSFRPSEPKRAHDQDNRGFRILPRASRRAPRDHRRRCFTWNMCEREIRTVAS